MRVQATDLILDDGRVFAAPGDLGEVLDAGEDAGTRWVMVQFPGVEDVTTCILGVEVEPVLSLVAPAEPATEPPERLRPRRAWVRRRGAVALGFATSAAIAVALLVWRARPMPDAGTVDTQRTSQAPFLADVHGRLAGGLFIGVAEHVC